tara:strand:+ start:2727 stop:3287 length:561 start_codon:yes stop_codon:yes gene_type:complete
MDDTQETWFEHFILSEELAPFNIFELLWDMKPDKPHQVVVYGKVYNTPRLQQAYGRDYAFAGTVSKSLPIPEELDSIIKAMSQRYNTQYNSLLVNWYRDGNDYIGHHSDNEKQLCETTPVITISFGAERDFVLKNKLTKKTMTTTLKNNSVFVMGGTCQKTHTHSIPKRKRVTSPRISVTLRQFTD